MANKSFLQICHFKEKPQWRANSCTDNKNTKWRFKFLKLHFILVSNGDCFVSDFSFADDHVTGCTWIFTTFFITSRSQKRQKLIIQEIARSEPVMKFHAKILYPHVTKYPGVLILRNVTLRARYFTKKLTLLLYFILSTEDLNMIMKQSRL